MSSKSKEHHNTKYQASSSPEVDGVNTVTADSPRHEKIRIRAYEIYMERGGEPGHDLDDWLQAERELELKVRVATAGQ